MAGMRPDTLESNMQLPSCRVVEFFLIIILTPLAVGVQQAMVVTAMFWAHSATMRNRVLQFTARIASQREIAWWLPQKCQKRLAWQLCVFLFIGRDVRFYLSEGFRG